VNPAVDVADSVALPSLPDEKVVARWDEVEILLVTPNSSLAGRGQAAAVALRAMRDTPFHEPGYRVSDEDGARILMARSRGVAIGLIILRQHPRWAWWSWDDWDAERRPSTGVAPLPSWTVESIWVHPAAQSRGLARRLLNAASSEVDQPITSFAWRRPFTPSGEALVRRCCPEGIWVPAT